VVNGELAVDCRQLILKPLHVPLKPDDVPAALDGTEQRVALDLQALAIFHGCTSRTEASSAQRRTSRFNNSPPRWAFLSTSCTERFKWLYGGSFQLSTWVLVSTAVITFANSCRTSAQLAQAKFEGHALPLACPSSSPQEEEEEEEEEAGVHSEGCFNR
jgi:hypothetical protein